MEEIRKPYKCDWCGSDCEFFIKGHSCGWKCKNCDYNIVTTYDPFRDVPNEFEISLTPEVPMTPEKYKYLSKLLEMNYLQLKEVIGDTEFKVKGDLYKTLHVMEKLDEFGIKHSENPKYPYSPDDEVYQKIKNNTVYCDDIG